MRRCLFHDWPRWSTPKVMDALWHGERVGDVVTQERTCRRCGRTEMREVYR